MVDEVGLDSDAEDDIPVGILFRDAEDDIPVGILFREYYISKVVDARYELLLLNL